MSKAKKPESLARILARLRAARGWSLREAAEASGVSHAQIALLENGKPNVTVSILRQLAAAYQIPAAELFEAA